MLHIEVTYQSNGKTRVGILNKSYRTMRGAEKKRAEYIRLYDMKPEDVRITGTEEKRPTRELASKGMVNVGDIFHCSWGYSMCLNDFYEVVKVSDSGKTCTLRKLAAHMLSDSSVRSGGYKVAPDLTGDDRFVSAPIPNKRINVYHSDNRTLRPSIHLSSFQSALLVTAADCEQGFYENHWD